MAGALIVAGFLGGMVDVLMNAEGARIERGLGRPILARLHAAASAGMALGAILGSLIAAGPAPWAAGVLAALALAGAGVAYHRAAGAGRPAQAAVGACGPSGLSFAPALMGLGVVVGVSIAAELAASVWSTLLLREEAPKLAAISGLGAAFFSACQAALRFNADAIRLRVSDLRIIIASFAIAAAGFALVSGQAGFAASVAGFALIGVGTGPIVPCGFALAARQSAAGPAVGLASASLFSALSRLPAPLATGAIAQTLSLPAAFAAFALALATTAAAAGRRRFREPGAASAAQSLRNSGQNDLSHNRISHEGAALNCVSLERGGSGSPTATSPNASYGGGSYVRSHQRAGDWRHDGYVQFPALGITRRARPWPAFQAEPSP